MLDYYGPMTLTRRILVPLLATIWMAGVMPAAAQTDAPSNSDLNTPLLYEILVGELSAQSDDPSAAYTLILDAAKKSSSPELFERAIEIALRARAGDSALQAAQAWSSAFPASRDANRYVLQILVGLNKLGETVEPLKRAIAAMPANERVAAIDLLPRYFARAADKKLAASVIEQALAQELNNPGTGAAAWSTVGMMRLIAGDASGATEAVRKGTALNARAPEPVSLALTLMEQNQPGAEAFVTQYLESPAGADIRMAYVRRLLELQRYSDASTQVDIVTRDAPDYPEGWLVRGSLEFENKQLDAAQGSLNRYLPLAAAAGQDRGLVQAYFVLSQIAETKNQLDVALELLDNVNGAQDFSRVQVRRASLLVKQGKLDQARTVIESLPEEQPEEVRAKINAEVQILREAKQFAAAYDVLAKAQKEYPQDADLAYDLAMAAEKVGKVDDMEKLLRQIISVKPDYHHAYNALGYSLADRKQRLPEARQLVQKALEFAPNDPFIIDSMGWVEFRSGNNQEALRLLQFAYKNRPDAEIAAHLGEVLWAMSQSAQAKEIWKEGLTLNPDNETLVETIKRLSR
jgi:tetratricopeptide (TPR) repeat protein